MTNLTSKKKEKIFLPNLIEKRKRNKKKHFYISGTYEKLAVLSGHNNHRSKINLINQTIEPKIDHHHHHCESQIFQ